MSAARPSELIDSTAAGAESPAFGHANGLASASSPCTRCGACCATYRVAFHWSEADPSVGGCTPAALTERIDPHRVAMRGTTGTAHPRCIGLQGEIGVAVRCTIYDRRPSPCRELEPVWWPTGADAIDQCNRARQRHGLAALRLDDLSTLPDLATVADGPLPGVDTVSPHAA